MEQQLVVIADDLTGAADAAAAFLRLPDEVCVELGAITAVQGVVSVDTDSRARGAAEAREAHAQLAAALAPSAIVLKKVDSLLRGHVAAELEPLRARFPGRPVVVAPAFPANGRSTVDGVQRLHGVPLGATRGLGEGVAPSDRVADALAPLATRDVSLVRVRGTAGELAAELGRNGIAICDAEHDGDLDRIVAAACGDLTRFLWVGSAGLAAALARSLADGRIHRRAYAAPRRTLAIVGSTSEAALAQAQALLASGAEVVQVDGATLLDPAAARAFGHALEPALATEPLLVLVGGATARAILDDLGVRSLELVAELEPGVVLARPRPARGATMVITKAGSFGDAQTLVRALAVVAA